MSHAKSRIVAAALAACLAAVALAAGGASTLSDVFGSERWRLVSLTSGGETAELGPGAGAEFVVNELGQLAGTVGCNRLIAGATLTEEGEIAFEPVASTLMACPEPAMSRERAFVSALEALERYEVGEREVRLTGPGVEIVFEVASAPEG